MRTIEGIRRRGAAESALVTLAALALCLLGLLAIAPAAQGAEPPVLREFCPQGSAGGQCHIPRGLAVDPDSGDHYVADQENHRIQKFTAWGELSRAWGWDVVVSGPGDNGTEFEICVPADGDVCKRGVEGGGRGQLVNPQGIALDSAGDVYVAEGDFSNRRVQKFDSEGNFVLMFGGKVNKTKEEALAPEAEQNLCPIAPTDVCQAATEGSGNGQFGPWVVGSFIGVDRNSNTIYVGDKERIQRFDVGGHYLGDLPDPEGLLVGESVKSLTVDQMGNLYLSFFSSDSVSDFAKDDVLKLELPGGEEVCELKAKRVSAIAANSSGDEVWVVSARHKITGGDPMQIVRFDSACEEVDRFDAEAAGIETSTGLATSSACGIDGSDLLVSNAIDGNSFIRLYGPPPTDFDPPCNPPPDLAPTIEGQHAVSVSTDSAQVRAQINPHFWPDTTYHVQYGTAECKESLSACEDTALFPGAQLNAGVIDAFKPTAGVFLGDLQPDTTYFYRFVSESSGGGPAFGEGEEACTLDPLCGQGGSFHTYPTAAKAKVDCPNQSFRSGLSAPLPDCRAYEMVSPLDKNNGDIGIGEKTFSQGSLDGNRATYSSFRAFADPQGAGFSNQYLSSRDPAKGWLTHSINPPRTAIPFYAVGGAGNFAFKAFSEDLCEGWVLQETEVELAPGAPKGVPNLYRRNDRDCAGKDDYELLTTVAPPGFGVELEPNDSLYHPEPQGASADGSRSFYRSDAALTPDACPTKGIYQVYAAEAGALHLVSVLPSLQPSCAHSSVGTKQDIAGNFRGDSVYRAVSEDGERVFWSVSAAADKEDPVETGGGDGDEAGPLYLRLHPTEPQSALALGAAAGTGNLNAGSKTVLVLKTTSGAFAIGQDISGPGIPAGTTITAVTASSLTLSLAATEKVTGAALGASSDCTEADKACTLAISQAANARFVAADPEGTAALYTAEEKLFEYDVAEDKSNLIAAGVKGVAGASEDLSRVYFVSTEALSGEAVAGAPNLFLHERGVGFAFVATLAELDIQNQASTTAPPSPIATLPYKRTSRVTPDGMHLAFASIAPLTGADNLDAASGEPATEVFLYDAADAEFACASCNPSGARPRGRNFGGSGGKGAAAPFYVAARVPGWESQSLPSRALSADGNRLFFESYEPLVLRDTNGKQDVYEWARSPSKEECEEEIGGELYLPDSSGCLSLISSGQSSTDAEFFDASATGSDVFFATTSSLLAEDYGLLDVYDARSGGGFPPPATPKPPCEGEACQPAASVPEDPTPASSMTQRDGNVVNPPKRPRCAKNKRRVMRKGKARCVPKRKQSRRQSAKRRAGR